MESVYVETSIISYLVSNPSRDAITLWRQKQTQDWWNNERQAFACFISQEIIDEISAGDVGMAQKRIHAVQNFPAIEINSDIIAIGSSLIANGLFPPKAKADANHLAIATHAGVDYLLTWNYRHLANAIILRRVENFFTKQGLKLPRVCTPEELRGT